MHSCVTNNFNYYKTFELKKYKVLYVFLAALQYL